MANLFARRRCVLLQEMVDRDPANEALIVEALERLKGSLTIVVIAHRGALSALADRTYRLEAGLLVK